MLVSPRFLRPHTVMIKHHLGEDNDGREQLEEYEVKRVNFQLKKGSSRSKTGTSDDDNALLTIDLNDYDSAGHSLNVLIDDIVIYNNQEFTVTSVASTPVVRNSPSFMEVRLK